MRARGVALVCALGVGGVSGCWSHVQGASEQARLDEESAALQAEREAWLAVAPSGGSEEGEDEDACRIPLLQRELPPLRVNLEMERDADATARHTLVHEGSLVRIEFEERSADGYLAGVDTFACAGSALHLVETSIDARRIRFAPPIPVLSQAALPQSVAMETTLLVIDEDRHWSVPARWEATFAEAEGPDHLQAPGRTFTLSRSLLRFESEVLHALETETLWALSVQGLFIASRNQRAIDPSAPSSADGWQRSELARLVFPESNTPVPQD